MSFVKIMVHVVWATKERKPVLTTKIKSEVIAHIKENAKLKGIYIDSINGHTEHLHCLLALNADISISKVMQLIKGESAFWINKEKLTTSKFEWANEYFAVSVSESVVEKVRAYINRQEEHHKKLSFKDEYESFLNHHM
jgi:REP element-mobilizing transposase RayT